MKYLKRNQLCFLIISFFLIAHLCQGQDPQTLWYYKPASDWSSEALPIGNGRMGAMLWGGVKKDVIQFNEQSLWSGSNNWDGDYDLSDLGFGTYLNAGEIISDFVFYGEPYYYKRSLNISNGIHTTEFIINQVKYTREAFASFPSQVMVFKYSASKKSMLSGRISLQSAQGAKTLANPSELRFNGELPNTLKYISVVKVLNTGGNVFIDNDMLRFVNCTEIILVVNTRTNYNPDYYSSWRGQDPLALTENEVNAALIRTYNELKNEHITDLSSLLNRVNLDFGSSNDSLLALPIDERLKIFAANKGTKRDLDLEELMFYYGRYLLASCSRPGGLPANLQGLWNNSNTPPWASDYHSNINLQMNYWLAESTNLSDCALPLIDFIDKCRPSCRLATKKAFGEDTRGWTARTSQSIYGGNGWEWNIPASAWYAQHVYEHWAFTNDTTYLKNTALPIFTEICEFWEDHLKTLPDGSLVVPNGWSPEHGPREDGIMHDQQLVWDLFQNYIEMAQVLNCDMAYRKKISDMQSRLAPNKIGKWGQLQEWQEDRDDPDDQHRHSSHLFAVYPGRQISITCTPDLARAAIISLRSRCGNYGINANTPFTVESTIGDSRRSWSWPWRCALWARLGEAEKAGIMIDGLLTFNTVSNLFTNHPPFQIDGNFGISAAIAEMLLQSHAGEIHLLPALPVKWAKIGSFSGLVARGGFWVDCKWENGIVTSYHIFSTVPKTVKVRVNGQLIDVKSMKI